jgi:hypothetical protein
MHPKPLSLTAIQRQNAKMQAAVKMTMPSTQAPPQDLTMLQTLLAQQQQMGMQMPGQSSNPMEAFMAVSSPPTNNITMQLAMLQEMQNRHNMQQMQVPVAASTEESKPKESFGEKLVRTNPALAAQLIEAKSLNMMSPNCGVAANIASNPMMAMLAAQSTQMQQPNMNLTLQQMSNPRGEQQNLTSMMFALLQQEQQQQQLQQQKDFIKNFMSQQSQPQHREQQQQRPSLSDNSLVTPLGSAASLLHNNLAHGQINQGSASDENWLSALLNRSNNAVTKQQSGANPDGTGKSDDV